MNKYSFVVSIKGTSKTVTVLASDKFEAIELVFSKTYKFFPDRDAYRARRK